MNRIFLLLLFAGKAFGSLPCSVGGKLPGTWDGTVQKERLGRGYKVGDYWSLTCKTDTSNWIQLVERPKKGRIKVLMTFAAGRFICVPTTTSSMCDIETDIEVIEGKTVNYTADNGDAYDCNGEKNTGDPAYDGCMIGHPLFIPEKDFTQAADSMDQELIRKAKIGWGKAPKPIARALPQESIETELGDDRYDYRLISSASEMLKIEKYGILKRNLQWMDIFSKDLDGDGKPETIQQAILKQDQAESGSTLAPKAYLIAIYSKGRRNFYKGLLYGAGHCPDLQKGGLTFQFRPHPTIKKASMIEFKIEDPIACGLPLKAKVHRDTVLWDPGSKEFLQKQGKTQVVDLMPSNHGIR